MSNTVVKTHTIALPTGPSNASYVLNDLGRLFLFLADTVSYALCALRSYRSDLTILNVPFAKLLFQSTWTSSWPESLVVPQ